MEMVWFSVPTKNFRKADQLLRIASKQGVVAAWRRAAGEIMVVRRDGKDSIIPVKCYTAVLVGHASVRTMLNELWDQKIVPSGRQWMINYHHARKKDLKELGLV